MASMKLALGIEGPPVSGGSERPGRGSVILLAVIGLGALIGVYAVLGYWVSPQIIRSLLVTQIEQRYHRRASIGPVRVDPFALRFEARQFSLADTDGRPMLAFGRLSASVGLEALWRGGVLIKAVDVEGPMVRAVIRRDGRLNLADLAAPQTAPRSTPQPSPRLEIGRLDVRGGRVVLADTRPATAFSRTVDHIDATLDRFELDRGTAAYTVKAVTDQAEILSAHGSLGLSPVSSTGIVRVAGLRIAPLAARAGGMLPFDVTSGAIDLAARYRFSLDRDRLDVRLDNGALHVSDVGLKARGAPVDWIRLPLVSVSDFQMDLPARRVSVGSLEMDQPTVDAWRDARGGINLQQYLGSSQHASPVLPFAGGGPAWKVELPEVHVRNAVIAFQDRSTARPVKLAASNASLFVRDLAWPLTRPFHVDTRAALDDGGSIAASGAIDATKRQADLRISAAGLALTRLQPYLDQASGVRLLSGRLSAIGRVSYDADTGAAFDGEAGVDDLHTVDQAFSQDFINWRALRMRGVVARSTPLALKVADLTLVEPYARVAIDPNYMTNVQVVLDPLSAVASAPPARKPRPARRVMPNGLAPRASVPIDIAVAHIENGRTDFADLSIKPNFSAGIYNLNGEISGLSGRAGTKADVDLTGQVDRYAPVSAKGEVNFLSAEAYTDLTMNFSNIDMATFSPYSGKFAGYRIEKGKLGITLHYNIINDKLTANHRIVINQLRLGDRVESADAVKLPVKLLVALLKDRNGVIDVPIDISGSLDDPKFRVWPVIWKVVENMVDKIAAAPFSALGKVFGAGEELQYITFAPGSADLDAAARRKVATLAKALAEHASINLEIPEAISPSVDGPALTEARYQAEVAGAPTADAHARRLALEAICRKQFGSASSLAQSSRTNARDGVESDAVAIASMEGRLRAAVVTYPKDFEQLAVARAQAVEDALLAGSKIDPSRVFITAAPPADTGAARMILALK